MLPSDLHRHVSSPPLESSRLAELPTWQATIACGATLLIVLPVLLVPDQLAIHLGISMSQHRTIVAGFLGMCGAIIGFTLFAWCLRISPQAIFLRFPSREGILAIALVCAITAVLLLVTTWLTTGTFIIESVPPRTILLHFLVALAIGLWTGTIEEIFLRGALFAILGNQWSWTGALWFSAVLFGLLHTGAGETTIHTICYVILTTIAGLLFGVVTIVTGNVWNAVALHATWNSLFSGYLLAFGATDESTPLIRYQFTESHWLLLSDYTTVTESPITIVLFLTALIGVLLLISDQPILSQRQQQ